MGEHNNDNLIDENMVEKLKIADSSIRVIYAHLRINVPMLYRFMDECARLSIKIGCVYDLQDDEEYTLACRWANVGMLATDGIFYNGTLDKRQMEFFRKHVTRAEDHLNEIGLNRTAEIVKKHHERPNATGYLKLTTYPFESNLIRIADEFCMLTRPSQKRMNNAFDVKEAARIVLQPFVGYDSVISTEHQALIKHILENHHG